MEKYHWSSPFFFTLFYVCCCFACLHVCVPLPCPVPTEVWREHQMPGTGVTGGCRLPCRWQEPNLGAAPLLLPAKPPLQPSSYSSLFQLHKLLSCSKWAFFNFIFSFPPFFLLNLTLNNQEPEVVFALTLGFGDGISMCSADFIGINK
jgi:hypothetical protein